MFSVQDAKSAEPTGGRIKITFRHAVHLKHKSLIDDHPGNVLGTLFSRGVKVRLRDWVRDVLKGLEGGVGVLRLACAGGVLTGLGDLEGVGKLKAGSGEAGRGRVEDEVVVALADVMELYESAAHGGGWEKEFQPVTGQGDVEALSLALILASHSLPLVPTPKLKALSLPILAHHLTSTISSAFQSGSFPDLLPSSITPKDVYKIHISPTSSFPSTLTRILASPLYTSLALLSKLTACVLSTLVESKPSMGLVVAGRTLNVMEGLARDVERAWVIGGLDEPESRELTTQIWTILKTFLFTTIMISESILSTTVFIPPSSFSSSSSPSTSTSTQTPTPKSLSLQTLQTLSHLSFIISQFGGVTTTSTSSTDFPELKKTFYIALDVLTSSEREGSSAEDGGIGEQFVKRLCAEDAPSGAGGEAKERRGQLQPAKKAFALACIEQLVPILSDNSLPMVFQTCFPYLYDPSHRETFESAHSIILGIFAAHAQKAADVKLNAKQRPSNSELKGTSFVESLVPFYAGCLIENSVSGPLSTPQLRLAYSALVRSASSGAHTSTSSPADARALALPQFCIDTLLSAINAPSTPSSSPSASDGRDHLHRLHLTLISTLPSLHLPLLSCTLESIRSIVLSLPLHTDGDERRKELVEELFKEILEKVGDREKETVMRWWYDVRAELLGDGGEKREEGEATTLSRL
ncbi:hypothetical protein PILCRDRAFT_768547 [Piloderma croceum F 1598]|uniref:MMS19 nucleotide excision repair protein n=1 Tax=Piloderma croceum (strain F 1598) TaxID=765440 RepID=A0A0C3GBV8_PILCF|nr:hypothetical protein PILCRDRAFT_768547 [Piloderma croceum F 1598]